MKFYFGHMLHRSWEYPLGYVHQEIAKGSFLFPTRNHL